MPDIKNLKIDTLIFDMDGTLLDTLDDLKDSVNYALNYLGYREKTKEEIRLAVGSGITKLGITKLFERVVPGGLRNPDITECIKKFKEYYTSLKTSKTHPYDGVIELLTELKKRGYKTGIVSNKFDIACKMHSKAFFGNLIDYAQGEDEMNGIIRKPNPSGVLKVLDILGSKSENSVFLGDSDIDIQTAKNANMPCISVLWGFRSEEFLIQSGGNIFVKNPSEILTMV